MKNKNLIIAILIILVVTVIMGTGTFLLLGKKSNKLPETDTEIEEQVKKISKDEIGLKLKMGSDGKRVVFEVGKTENIASLDYQLSYNSKDNIPRGAIGHIEIKIKGQPVKKEIVLGTCSDVCHYDEDVSNIKLILKVTKLDGKIYQAEVSL